MSCDLATGHEILEFLFLRSMKFSSLFMTLQVIYTMLREMENLLSSHQYYIILTVFVCSSGSLFVCSSGSL